MFLLATSKADPVEYVGRHKGYGQDKYVTASNWKHVEIDGPEVFEKKVVTDKPQFTGRLT